MATFKAVEIDPATARPTGATRKIEAATRRDALASLIATLPGAPDAAQVSPNGSMVRVGDRAWMVVPSGPPPAEKPVSSRLRRAGAKHRA